MSSDAVKTLVQAFISCRLDYCNSLFYGISHGLITRLQSVQNAATCLVSGAGRRDAGATPVAVWIQRVDFKVATLVYCSLTAMAPPYLIVSWSLMKVAVSYVLSTPRTCRRQADLLK